MRWLRRWLDPPEAAQRMRQLRAPTVLAAHGQGSRVRVPVASGADADTGNRRRRDGCDTRAGRRATRGDRPRDR
jgi:hypothetical protein